MSWNDERVEKLKQGIEQGLTASAIARMVGGVTRNAVIGKVHRLGLNLLNGGTPAQRLAQRANGKRMKREQLKRYRERKVALGKARAIVGPNTGRGHEINQAAHARAIAVADTPPPQALMVSLLDLEPHHCRWPIGEPGKPGFGFCGCQKAPVGSYCTHHAQMAVREVYVSSEAGYWGSNMRKRFAAA